MTTNDDEGTNEKGIPVQRFRYAIDENIVVFAVRGEQVTLAVGTNEKQGEGDYVGKISAYVELRLNQLEEVVAAARDQLTRYAPYSAATAQKIAVELMRAHNDVLKVLGVNIIGFTTPHLGGSFIADETSQGVIRIRFRTRVEDPRESESANDAYLEDEVVEIANPNDLSRVVLAANERRQRWNTAIPPMIKKNADVDGKIVEDPVSHKWHIFCAVRACDRHAISFDTAGDLAEDDFRRRGWQYSRTPGWYCPDHAL